MAEVKMKELILPIYHDIITEGNDSILPNTSNEVEEDSSKWIELLKKLKGIHPEIKQAMDNGSKIIYCTIIIEKSLSELILTYYLGKGFSSKDKKFKELKQDLFESSAIEFSFKKELAKRLIKQNSLLNIEVLKKLEKYLKKIMLWRNAFAHGTLQYHQETGCQLLFFSGIDQKIILNNSFWDEVEDVFTETEEIIQEVICNA
jgi:hypothetical protein